MGPAVYLKLTEIEGFTYKTTLLGGRWDVGEAGIRIFGAMWLVPAIGFAVAAAALLAGWQWWMPAAIAAAIFSLGLTGLDFSVAYAGIAVNIGILIAVALNAFIGTN